MADRITALEKLDDKWCISYAIEKDSLSDSFCITVFKADMNDPDSDIEVRSLANAKAAAIKNAWIPETPSVVIQIIDEPENVAL